MDTEERAAFSSASDAWMLRGGGIDVVVSEWDDVDHVRAWEHFEEHEGVMQKWEPSYREPLVHQRFVPWRRPES